MSQATTTLEAVIKRERAVVMAGLVVVALLAWGYTVLGVGMPTSAVETTMMSGPRAIAMASMTPAAWDWSYALVMVLMWWVMMIAMMLPGAAPMILLFAAVNRRGRARVAAVATGYFAAGYLAAWAGFSVAATAAQWGLEMTGLLSPMMATRNVVFGAALLIGAGMYQFTPLKQACLKHCRSPVEFLSRHWRKGSLGAVEMGMRHGLYCLGCCWFLMALLFFGGVMNLYWIAALALFVLLEKMLPAGLRLDRISGAALVAWGVVLLGSILA